MSRAPIVVNLGLPKSGTTTLAKALHRAGFKVADWMVREEDGRKRGFVGRLMYLGYFETGDPLQFMQDRDAFTEISVVRRGRNYWPQMDWALLDAIRKHHPGTKFTLSWRDPAKHADSMRRWSNLGRTRLPESHVPGLPMLHGDEPGELERWIEGHHTFCRHVFRGDPDFMEYEVSDTDAQSKLSAHLGVDLPWWGQANVNVNHKAEDGSKEGAKERAEEGETAADTPDAPTDEPTQAPAKAPAPKKPLARPVNVRLTQSKPKPKGDQT